MISFASHPPFESLFVIFFLFSKTFDFFQIVEAFFFKSEAEVLKLIIALPVVLIYNFFFFES